MVRWCSPLVIKLHCTCRGKCRELVDRCRLLVEKCDVPAREFTGGIPPPTPPHLYSSPRPLFPHPSPTVFTTSYYCGATPAAEAVVAHKIVMGSLETRSPSEQRQRMLGRTRNTPPPPTHKERLRCAVHVSCCVHFTSGKNVVKMW